MKPVWGLILHADGQISEFESNGVGLLKDVQSVVGGYIEPIRLAEGLMAYVNEEGLMRDMPHNQLASVLVSRFYFYSAAKIHGDLLLLGDDGSEDEVSIDSTWRVTLRRWGFRF